MKRTFRVKFLRTLGPDQGVCFAEMFLDSSDLVTAYYRIQDRHDCISVLCVEQMTKERTSIQYVEEVEH
jgi:hypothetical protein